MLTRGVAGRRVGGGNRIARGAAPPGIMGRGRIGKPVRFRHGPATVNGESSGTGDQPLPGKGREGARGQRSMSQETCRALSGRFED